MRTAKTTAEARASSTNPPNSATMFLARVLALVAVVVVPSLGFFAPTGIASVRSLGVARPARAMAPLRAESAEVLESLKDVVAEQLGVEKDQITPDKRFQEDLGADSLDSVELIMALEEKFELDIPDEEAETIVTVQAALDYVVANAS